MTEGFELHNSKKRKRKKLLTYLGVSGFLSILIFFIEAIGSKESGSLALFADAGHIATDIFAHLISFLAIIFSAKKANDRYPFGYHRIEVLAALANSILLVGISIFILFESYERMTSTTEIHVHSMLFYSIIGLIINFMSAGLLFKVSKESLNLKSAYLHVLSDLLGTVAVVIGAIIIQYTGFLFIDSILSIFIGIFILKTSYSILKESIQILLEAYPSEFDKEHFLNHITSIKGISSVKLFKVRKLTSGVFTLEIQLIVKTDANRDEITLDIHKIAKSHFGIPYVFVETISEGYAEKLSVLPILEKEDPHHHHGHHHH
ncbi:MAG: cation diffusion facilitator family transporter [Leptospira sp.]|nr:cation diffusion facilitator family transporter [Leptospira sp.]